MKYKVTVEYEYPCDHKPPVKADIYLHGDKVTTREITPIKTGHWIDADGDNAICGCCNRLNHLYGDYCKHCGAKMEGE